MKIDHKNDITENKTQEINTLYKVINIIVKEHDLGKLLKKVCSAIPGYYPFPEHISVRIDFDNIQYVSRNFHETTRINEYLFHFPMKKRDMLKYFMMMKLPITSTTAYPMMMHFLTILS
ncbi:MAG: hypothetical protein HC906_02090 [Bacteroidales bacterium]|nr:hypothetical protein [Bacteroidales bacterium]